LKRSAVYETEPVGEVARQRDFYNAAVKVEIALQPRELLDRCKQIERELGRPPGGARGGPRPIDLDVLLVGDLAIADEWLVVPHPELVNRRFVLTPLLELEPDLSLPDGTPLARALALLGPGQRVVRIGSL
jgi:2-amino-4-hydroxy-6-hydroxymethyldihydropteridine diphosphokinase